MTKLAVFDVDFTLTRRETLMEFYIFMVKKDPKLILYAPFSIFSAFLFVLGLFTAKKAKENFISFIKGISEENMKLLTAEFYEKRLCKIFYKDALDTIKKLKKEGYKIYLISASAEFYLRELYKIEEVDKVIGTIFSVKNGKHYNKIIGKNCKGEEKVRRLLESLKKDGMEVDFKNSYMFSDSLSDLPLFKIVGNPCLINYRKNNPYNIKVLNWK
ncbi:HAD-IB family hydrolase [Clostridium luticellarii]|uniref:HAD-IB family hydrolase n=1 Tax=Clostridium luticellarii TaxID=1691940 RepID=UPI002352EC5C|nr:HAD-IB family hydrolase [Clostridium luticellarii]MCI1943980.1 HAD-IB family hydrolase [Clostridium luticellarii]MCI1967378.1 HAD-IB family hydrolase [Clostridium luticellarii]MCI1996103.1 HAD-IB family hydrolase [Clostridium luticellarii]MCI2039135.1 HAD-IB family hydrolase [Clostridium luticellarii]